MSRIKLDLKQFKHVRSDKDSTTLRHSGGHELTLAHNSLSPEARDQLKALSRVASDAQTKANTDELKHKGMYGKGGGVHKNWPQANPSGSGLGQKGVHGEYERRGESLAGIRGLKDEKLETSVSNKERKEMHSDKLKELRSMPRPKLADGGEIFPDKTKEQPMQPQIRKPKRSGPPGPNKAPQSQTYYEDKNSKDYGNIRFKLAEGGEADHECEGASYCMHCGGAMPTKMATGGEPEPEAPSALRDVPPDNDLVNSDLSQLKQMTDKDAAEADRNQLRDMYSSRAIQNAQQANPMGGPLAGLYASNKLPGPDGEPPKDIDTDAAMQAKVAFDQKKADEAKQRIDLQQKSFNQARKANEAAALMGYPQQPLPGAPPDQSRAAMVPEQPKPQMPFPNAGKDQGEMPQTPEQGIMAGYETQIAGLKGQGQALAAQGERNIEIERKAADAQREANMTFQKAYKDLEQERQAHMQDIQEGMINPDKYWTGDPKTGEGGHSKIMTGIGMILAGFNPTTQPNAAINFLKMQMDRNLEAQKQNLGAKQNLLAANLRQFGNLKDATDMTRIMQNDAVVHMLQSSAAKAQSGPNGLAANAAKIAIGPLMRESAQLQFQMSMRQMMAKLQSGQQGDPSNTAAFENAINMMYQIPGMQDQAKHYASMVVPGVGVSKSQEIPKDVRDTMISRKNFDQMLNKYQQFVQKHGGSMNMATSNEGKALAAELQGAYRQASNGGVFKEGEQNFIEQLVPSDPTQLFHKFRTDPKIKELIRSNTDQLNQLKSGWGMAVPQAAPTNPLEGKTAVNDQGQRIINRNGQWVPIR